MLKALFIKQDLKNTKWTEASIKRFSKKNKDEDEVTQQVSPRRRALIEKVIKANNSDQIPYYFVRKINNSINRFGCANSLY